jgi:hypothetical protein
MVALSRRAVTADITIGNAGRSPVHSSGSRSARVAGSGTLHDLGRSEPAP